MLRSDALQREGADAFHGIASRQFRHFARRQHDIYVQRATSAIVISTVASVVTRAARVVLLGVS